MSKILAATRVHRVAPLVLVALLWCRGGLAQVVEQFSIPGGPSSIALGPDGAMWFTQRGPKIGRIDASGVATEFPIPANPYAIALGSDRNLWLTTTTGIGRMTPGGVFTPFVASAGAFRITSGPDGNLWFTKFDDARIGRITTSGEITEFALPTKSLARNITAGADGNIWFTMPADDKIGRITLSGVVTEFATPTSHVSPLAISAGSDGNVWFTDSYPGIGRITPSGAITEFSVSDTFSLTKGADGNVWAAGLGTLKRIAPDGSTSAFSVPTETADWFATLDMAAAPDGSIWIADYSNSQIVRFSQPPAATCVADVTTLCLNGRFRVTADWRTRAGSNGQGRAVALTSDSGYFWFFNAANVEVVVKVLNGCGSNSRYWTFAGGLTDVNVILSVTDTQTGAIKTYTNPQGTPFQPIQDTAAFGTCP